MNQILRVSYHECFSTETSFCCALEIKSLLPMTMIGVHYTPQTLRMPVFFFVFPNLVMINSSLCAKAGGMSKSMRLAPIPFLIFPLEQQRACGVLKRPSPSDHPTESEAGPRSVHMLRLWLPRSAAGPVPCLPPSRARGPSEEGSAEGRASRSGQS